MRYIAQVQQRDEDSLWQARATLIEGEGIAGDQSDFILDGVFNSKKEAINALNARLDSEGYRELITKERFKDLMSEAFLRRGFKEVMPEEYDGGATLVFICIGNALRTDVPQLRMKEMGGWGCVSRDNITARDAANREVPAIKYSFVVVHGF